MAKRLEYQYQMVDKLKKIFTSQQKSVFSAASVIMLMVVLSRILGLVRQRILANYFAPSELSLFFAAFRLPDIIFEVLVFGTFASAFIPVFTKVLRQSESRAWSLAGRVVSIGLGFFSIIALLFSLFATGIYSVISPGFSEAEIVRIASIARILFAAQGIFIVSYVLTGVLESLRRFLVPALAPIFYNLGIIVGTVAFSDNFGLMGPAIGVVLGALGHFLIQYPLSRKLGFRFTLNFGADGDVKKIGKLALPRIIDLFFDQFGKTTELFLASLIGKASYTYFTFANSLQLLPVSIFGTSLAKAVLPALSRNDENIPEFRKILKTAIFQAMFLTLPISAALIVLRVPVVRLVYGTKIFDWTATLETGSVLMAFSFGIVFQTLMAILARSFFALHDTKTPVIISFIGLSLLIILDFVLVLVFGYPVWGLGAAFTTSVFIETVILLLLINKKIGKVLDIKFFTRSLKIVATTLVSGSVMFFILKIFDRSVWVKKLSFLGNIEAAGYIPFEKFVLDTRYGFNLLVLTFMTFTIGALVYFAISYLLKVEEASYFVSLVKGIITRRISPQIPQKEGEIITSAASDTKE